MAINEDQVRQTLRIRGAADHIVRGGAQGLIGRWRTFVDEVAAGYPLGIDDYRNDLDIRELIDAAGLGDDVREEDDRLRSLLTATWKRVWQSDAPDAFWVQGYPHNASGLLLEDLRAERLMDDIPGQISE